MAQNHQSGLRRKLMVAGSIVGLASAAVYFAVETLFSKKRKRGQEPPGNAEIMTVSSDDMDDPEIVSITSSLLTIWPGSPGTPPPTPSPGVSQISIASASCSPPSSPTFDTRTNSVSKHDTGMKTTKRVRFDSIQRYFPIQSSTESLGSLPDSDGENKLEESDSGGEYVSSLFDFGADDDDKSVTAPEV
ncbi:hypothetical protein AX16_008558 [Volvariella volvacea WC 439]|nr:hypothetical protein AX16_008558 [Volvariella volvacea WC 439]